MTGKTIQRTFPLADIACFACRGWVQRQTEGAVVNHELTWLKIKPQGTDTTVIPLSGGNQQRVAVAKWLSMRPRLFVFNNPTRGIAGEGAGILMIFSDLEKVPGILDRTSVAMRGRSPGHWTGRPSAKRRWAGAWADPCLFRRRCGALDGRNRPLRSAPVQRSEHASALRRDGHHPAMKLSGRRPQLDHRPGVGPWQLRGVQTRRPFCPPVPRRWSISRSAPGCPRWC